MNVYVHKDLNKIIFYSILFYSRLNSLKEKENFDH